MRNHCVSSNDPFTATCSTEEGGPGQCQLLIVLHESHISGTMHAFRIWREFCITLSLCPMLSWCLTLSLGPFGILLLHPQKPDTGVPGTIQLEFCHNCSLRAQGLLRAESCAVVGTSSSCYRGAAGVHASLAVPTALWMSVNGEAEQGVGL